MLFSLPVPLVGFLLLNLDAQHYPGFGHGTIAAFCEYRGRFKSKNRDADQYRGHGIANSS